MCIIIYKTATNLVPKEYLHTSLKNNPHGLGIMWIENNRVVIIKQIIGEKQLDSVDNLINNELRHHDVAIHFRYATHGSISVHNIHPITILNQREQLYLMHNGTFTLPVEYNDIDVTDTEIFAQSFRQVMHQVSTTILDDTDCFICLNKNVGQDNKLLFMNNYMRKKIHILNESKGKWHNGVWYSNTYSLIPNFRKIIQKR